MIIFKQNYSVFVCRFQLSFHLSHAPSQYSVWYNRPWHSFETPGGQSWSAGVNFKRVHISTEKKYFLQTILPRLLPLNMASPKVQFSGMSTLLSIMYASLWPCIWEVQNSVWLLCRWYTVLSAPYSRQCLLKNLYDCLNNIKCWMARNLLQLNGGKKTEVCLSALQALSLTNILWPICKHAKGC